MLLVMLAACLQTKIAAQFQLPQNRHLKPAGEASPAQRRPGHPPDGRCRPLNDHGAAVITSSLLRVAASFCPEVFPRAPRNFFLLDWVMPCWKQLLLK